MSRVIRFRAWAAYGEMLANVQNHIGNGPWAFGNILMKPDEFSIMQFTGLLDANGVEIYEGDICVWYINNLERLGEVYYHDQSFEMRSPSLGYIGWDANRGEIKVVGNIYQNPELLN
jgi:hypothetical protein